VDKYLGPKIQVLYGIEPGHHKTHRGFIFLDVQQLFDEVRIHFSSRKIRMRQNSPVKESNSVQENCLFPSRSNIESRLHGGQQFK